MCSPGASAGTSTVAEALQRDEREGDVSTWNQHVGYEDRDTFDGRNLSKIYILGGGGLRPLDGRVHRAPSS